MLLAAAGDPERFRSTVLYRTATTRIGAPPVKALYRHWQRQSLTHDRTGERRAGGTGELDRRVAPNHCCIAGNDDSLEIARARLKQASATRLFLDQYFAPLAKLSKVAVPDAGANSVDEPAKAIGGYFI